MAANVGTRPPEVQPGHVWYKRFEITVVAFDFAHALRLGRRCVVAQIQLVYSKISPWG